MPEQQNQQSTHRQLSVCVSLQVFRDAEVQRYLPHYPDVQTQIYAFAFPYFSYVILILYRWGFLLQQQYHEQSTHSDYNHGFAVFLMKRYGDYHINSLKKIGRQKFGSHIPPHNCTYFLLSTIFQPMKNQPEVASFLIKEKEVARSKGICPQKSRSTGLSFRR